MSQDDFDPDGLDVPASESDTLIREMYEQVQELQSEVSELQESTNSLEQENQQLREDNHTLKQKVTTLEEENAALRNDVDELQDEIAGLTDQMNAASSRADALYDEIEQAQKDITNQSFRAEERVAEITKRVAGIEEELGLEDWETSSSISPNACSLERFAAMPGEKRETELKTPVARATLVWENFDDWSSPTHKGRVIRSGELRKLLKAATGKKLAWTQVYRVMEEFHDNTTDQYLYLGRDGENDAFGKALIRLRNPTEYNTEASSDGKTSGAAMSL